MGAGLLALLSKSPPSKDGADSDGEMETADAKDDDKEMGLEDEHLTDAFDAIKSGDKDAFLEAMKCAIEACGSKGE